MVDRRPGRQLFVSGRLRRMSPCGAMTAACLAAYDMISPSGRAVANEIADGGGR